MCLARKQSAIDRSPIFSSPHVGSLLRVSSTRSPLLTAPLPHYLRIYKWLFTSLCRTHEEDMGYGWLVSNDDNDNTTMITCTYKPTWSFHAKPI